MTGNKQTIDIPCFKSFRANITLPQNNGGGSSGNDTLFLESSTDKPLGAPSPAPGTGNAEFYVSLKTDFKFEIIGTTVSANVSSEEKISPAHTYNAVVYLQGAPLVTVSGIVPSGHNLTIDFTVPSGTTFPAGTPAQVVLYQAP